MTARPKAKPAAGALCQCGRPLGHTGRHKGSSLRRNADGPRPTKRSRLAAAIAQEITDRHTNIAKLKREIRDREALLKQEEKLLTPLVTLHDAYKELALPAPAPEVAARSVLPTPKVPTVPAQPELDPGEPVEADMETIRAWAAPRGMTFTTWDELPAVNRKREQLGLAIFKRKFGRR